MKTLTLIFILTTLVACNVKEASKTKTEDCSLNGQKVDCKMFSPLETQKTSVKAEIKAAANITEDQIEILENAEASKEANGIECSLSVHSGQIFEITKSNEKLFFRDNGQTAVFLPTTKSNQWQMEIISNDLKVITTITLEDGLFSSSMICSDL